MNHRRKCLSVKNGSLGLLLMFRGPYYDESGMPTSWGKRGYIH